jgi:DNA-binding GntR family transcriptional regulator
MKAGPRVASGAGVKRAAAKTAAANGAVGKGAVARDAVARGAVAKGAAGKVAGTKGKAAMAAVATDALAHGPVVEASSTQQDAVYARLRQWVTVGRFQPGERLKIRDVAQALGVGLMPVRASLQRLAAEGALVNVPNAGVAVPRLGVAEFDDLQQTRMLLEGEAAQRGAARLSPGEIDTLQALCRRMGEALSRGDHRGYLAANEDFHRILYHAAGSPTLWALIDTLWLKAGPISNRLFETPEAAVVLNDAHEDLMAALARRASAAVRRAIERDLFVAGQFLRERLRAR